MSLGLSALSGFHAISQAAAGGLLTAVWQGGLLAAAAGMGLRLVPKTPAAVRFAIWFAVFGVVAALPVIAVWPHGASVTQAGGHGAWLTIDERWSLAIVAVWAFATLARAVTLVVAGFRVRALWKRATPVEFDMPEGSRNAQVCVSDEVDRPSVIGFLAPKILIPRWLIERLTAAELEQIVLHEAGHLGRADDWLNLVQKIALVVFPLNPALAWIERRLCFERELACDERVLQTTGAPKAYAACLTSLAEHRLGRSAMALALGLGGALGRESELGQRVGRILRFGDWMQPVQARMVMGVAMLGLLGGATELVRCPQVVGFSPSQAGVSQVAVVAPARVTNGFGYRAVVFRPEEARTTLRQPPTHRDGAAMNGAPRMVARRQPALRDVAAQDGTPDSSNGVTSRGADVRGTQWLVVTSWSGMDGSRMVLTTMAVPNAAGNSAAGASEGDAQGDAGRNAVAGEAQGAPQQVYRYAAVPVRGGWLVFQL